eukprot:1160515-Pelagomonas_calceolata.AAC.11
MQEPEIYERRTTVSLTEKIEQKYLSKCLHINVTCTSHTNTHTHAFNKALESNGHKRVSTDTFSKPKNGAKTLS